ncbi:hypothetical protein [Reinekea sp. G2M2-21]|uniref:hypothetical protein n=1 Tax=Reinekea sp. G2M2-21 TaxID=2788942 RepID=UPI0018A9E817|nr:hypothetical protein [Reinekea sp. G2M2-21]
MSKPNVSADVEAFLSAGGSIETVSEGVRTYSSGELYEAQQEGKRPSEVRPQRDGRRPGESTFGMLDRLTGGGYTDEQLLIMAEHYDICEN